MLQYVFFKFETLNLILMIFKLKFKNNYLIIADSYEIVKLTKCDIIDYNFCRIKEF